MVSLRVAPRWVGVLLAVVTAAGCGGSGAHPAGRLVAALPAFPLRAAAPSSTPSSSPALAAPAPLVAPLTAPGERPPQFVVISFDGSGGRPLWDFWRRVARRDHAHFTFFLSGVYLLGQANRTIYQPPHRMPGASDIGMSPTEAGSSDVSEITALLANLAGAWREGHEIGTHFNGHFCGPWGVGRWSSSDWGAEVDQFQSLLDHANANNGISPAVVLPFSAAQVVGARTPCLDGNPLAFLPALAQRGFRYDASANGTQGQWPYRDHRLWEMPLAAVRYAGVGSRLLATDYNLYFHDSFGEPGSPAHYNTWRANALATFTADFEASYLGNRAPVLLGNHFESWNGSAYTDALAAFADLECQRPQVHCVSYRDLADWLDAEKQRYPSVVLQ